MSSDDVTVSVTVNATKVAALLNGTNATAGNGTNATANATAADASAAPAATTADATDAAPAKKGPPMIFWIWGGYSLWTHIAAGLTYNAYNSFATTLYNARTTNNTAWTTSWITSTKPVSYWINSSYWGMFLQFFSVVGWILGIAGMKGPFLMLFQVSQAFPALELIAWLYTYMSYTACDSSTLTSTQFNKTTTTVTQLSSCKNADKSTTTKGYFGTSGTWAPKVNTDPYNTWFFVDVGTVVGQQVVNGLALGPIMKAFGPNKTNASNATNATAPAAAAANATAANSSNASNGSNATNGSGADVAVVVVPGAKGDDAVVVVKPDGDADSGDKKCSGWWGCL